jgi:hypothetical protein
MHIKLKTFDLIVSEFPLFSKLSRKGYSPVNGRRSLTANGRRSRLADGRRSRRADGTRVG